MRLRYICQIRATGRIVTYPALPIRAMAIIYPGLVVLLILSIPMGILIGVVYLDRHRRQSRGRRNPLTKALLRAPGTSLRKELDKSQDKLLSLGLAVTMMSSVAAGFYLGATFQAGGAGINAVVFGGTLIAMSLVLAVWQLIPLLQTVYRQRLGLDGELAVGEELNQLLRKGYRVFHDVPGPNYNVDHVVIGPNGVFAVETKSHPKTQQGFTAEFDGTTIQYPDWVDSEAVRQGLRQARSVSKHLTKACGRPIAARGVVVLPGWNVRQSKRTRECVVMSSGQIQREFPRLRGERQDAEQIQAIAHQIEQLCRSESPMPLSSDDEKRFALRPTL